MKARGWILAVLFAAAASRSVSAETKLKVEKLADGVWAAQPERGANVGWMLLGDGVLAIDSGGDAATGQEILKQIAETTGGKPVRYLVLTHAHADHSGGARAFAAAGARMLCHENAAGGILAYVNQAATEPADPLAGKPNLRPVVESISERSILLDGLHNVEISHIGAAHTSGDLVVYLANDKILFAGDIALNGALPFLQSADVDPVGWERALQALSKVPAQKMVPGHGSIGPTSGIAGTLAYVRRVNELAKKILDKGTRDEMIEIEIRAPENKIENVPMSESHVANVKAAVRAAKERSSRKPTPTPTPVPTPPRTAAPTPAAK